MLYYYFYYLCVSFEEFTQAINLFIYEEGTPECPIGELPTYDISKFLVADPNEYYFNKKIRWSNVGCQYDWNNRRYPNNKVVMPDELKELIGTFLLGKFDEFDEHELGNFTLEWKKFIWACKIDIKTDNKEAKNSKLDAIETAIRSEDPLTHEWKSDEIQWNFMNNLKLRRIEVRIPGLNATGIRRSRYTPLNAYKGTIGYIKPKSFWKIGCYNANSFIAIEDTQLTVFVCAFADGGVPQFKTFEIKINDILVQADTVCLLFENGNIIVFDTLSPEFLTIEKQNIDTRHGNHSSRLVDCGENKFFMSVNDQVYYYTRKSKTDLYELKINVKISGNDIKVVCSHRILVVLYSKNGETNRNKFLIDLYAIEDTLIPMKTIEFERYRYPLDVCIHEDKVLLTDNSNYIHILDTNGECFRKIEIRQVCTGMTLCASSIFLKVTVNTGHRMSSTVPWIFDIGTESIVKSFTNNILLANSINYLNGRVLITYNQGFELIE